VVGALSKHALVAARFRERHGDTYETVGEYYAAVAHKVAIVDLATVLPGFNAHDHAAGAGGL
jgi:hypothetical protein